MSARSRSKPWFRGTYDERYAQFRVELSEAARASADWIEAYYLLPTPFDVVDVVHVIVRADPDGALAIRGYGT